MHGPQLTRTLSRRRAGLSLAAVIFVLLALPGAGCSDRLVSPTPTPGGSVAPPPAPQPPGPTPTGEPAVSALSVGEFEILLFRRTPGAVFQYEPKVLEVIETTGKHAATIQSITIETDNGGTTERDCPSETIRIAAGGRTNLPVFLGYCTPYAIVGTEAAQVTFSAVFVDDNGGTGSVRITKSVAGCTLAGGFGSVSCRTEAR